MSINETRAIRAAVALVEERFGGRRCDAEDVSTCERCNVIYLARVLTKATPELVAAQIIANNEATRGEGE